MRRATGAATYDSARWRRFRKSYLRSTGWRCENCGDRPADTSKMHVHHLHHVADGGPMFDPANVEGLCATCHAAEHPEKGGQGTASPRPRQEQQPPSEPRGWTWA